MIIVAIEGGVGSGKTSLLSCLKQRIPNLHIVPEYFDIIPKEQHDEVLAKSEREKLDLFLSIEKERKEALEKISSPLVVLDRSFVTLFAYRYATGQYGNIEAGTLSRNSMLGNYILPDAILHLDVEDSERKRRVEQRGHPVAPVLLEPTYNQKMKEYIERFCQVGNGRTIDTTILSMDEICTISHDVVTKAVEMEIGQKAADYAQAALDMGMPEYGTALWRDEDKDR